MKVKVDILKAYIRDRNYSDSEFLKILGITPMQYMAMMKGKSLVYDTERALIKYFTPTVAQFIMIFEEEDYFILKNALQKQYALDVCA